MNPLEQLTRSDNPVIALLAFMNLTMASVVIYQWSYTMRKTVPKWIYDSLVGAFTENQKVTNETLTILKERK